MSFWREIGRIPTKEVGTWLQIQRAFLRFGYFRDGLCHAYNEYFPPGCTLSKGHKGHHTGGGA